MITLRINSDTLIQVHKNHLATPLIRADFTLRFTSYTNKRDININQYSLQEFHNFYLFTVDTSDLKKLDMSAYLQIVNNNDGSVSYQSDIHFK